jgi:ElaB/YqjD/DUF883 family membrane-anchored ribosome-binding protein
MATTSETDRNTSSEVDSGRLAGVRQSAADAYDAARERTRAAFSTTRESVRGAGQRTADGIDANPVAAVLGGLALGAVIGALIPRTQREQDLLGGTGRKLNDAGRQALNAARDAGRKELDEIGVSREGIRRRLEEFTDKAVGAVRDKSGGSASNG